MQGCALATVRLTMGLVVSMQSVQRLEMRGRFRPRMAAGLYLLGTRRNCGKLLRCHCATVADEGHEIKPDLALAVLPHAFLDARSGDVQPPVLRQEAVAVSGVEDVRTCPCRPC